jgi:hypothetical protein
MEVDDVRTETLPKANKQPWQPLWQFLQAYHPVIQQCVPPPSTPAAPRQYQHVLNEMSMDDDDNDNDDDSMRLVQFSVEKTLLWLHQKQRTVEQYLLVSTTSSQQHHHQQQMQARTNGAFTFGFTIAKENQNSIAAPRNMDHNDQQQKDQKSNEQQQQQQQCRDRVKEESVQLVCNYLSPAWQDHFVQYLKVHDSDWARILSQQQQQQPLKMMTDQTPPPSLSSQSNVSKRLKSNMDHHPTTTTMTPTVDWNMSLTTNTTTTDVSMTAAAATSSSSSSVALNKSKKLPLLQPISAGAKRLLKMNQRGIQSVSSFFGGGGGTKAKTKK